MDDVPGQWGIDVEIHQWRMAVPREFDSAGATELAIVDEESYVWRQHVEHSAHQQPAKAPCRDGKGRTTIMHPPLAYRLPSSGGMHHNTIDTKIVELTSAYSGRGP